MFDQTNPALRRDVVRAIDNRRYEKTDDGIFIPSFGGFGRGVYVDYINGVEVGETKNTIMDEFWVDLLKTYFDTTAKKTTFYVALFAGAITPLITWTAAGFTATASEIVSSSEGYTQSTRPVWSKATPTTPVIDNYASKAAFTIATASTLNVNGAALLTDSGKGSTAGVLISAGRYSATRNLQNADDYAVGYRLTLSSA